MPALRSVRGPPPGGRGRKGARRPSGGRARLKDESELSRLLDAGSLSLGARGGDVPCMAAGLYSSLQTFPGGAAAAASAPLVSTASNSGAFAGEVACRHRGSRHRRLLSAALGCQPRPSSSVSPPRCQHDSPPLHPGPCSPHRALAGRGARATRWRGPPWTGSLCSCSDWFFQQTPDPSLSLGWRGLRPTG